MHIVLTDLLTCPDCGDAHGLIARADRIVERHIEEGALGCPECRRQYPIRQGTAFFTRDDTGPGTPDPDAGKTPAGPAGGAESAIRIAALLGLDRQKGFVMLAGPAARFAAAVAALSDSIEVVAAGAGAAAGPGVSRLVLGGTLPFCPGKLHGIWLGGESADRHLEAAARALHPTARLVLEPAPADAESRLPDGLHVIARQDHTLVCGRAG